MNIILLSGGSGKRLWPLSNDIRSKQFVQIFRNENGGYESMLQRMYRGLRETDPSAKITVATAKNQISMIRSQIGEDVEISMEPCRRDTFPAIALSCAYLRDVLSISEEEAVVILPVDPYVNEDYFEAVASLYQLAESGKASLCLMGITPTYPSEKYGYIIPETEEEVSRVVSFQEKPDAETAAEYIRRGGLWNSGVFAFRLSYILNKAEELLGFTDYADLFSRYDSLEKISFDYAVAEHENDISVMRFAGEWKDLGTWNTLTEAMSESVIGNAVLNDTCRNVHVINTLDIPILVMGLKDAVVSAGPEGILVSDKEQSSYIKPYVDRFGEKVMYAEKSWGSFQVQDIEESSMTIKVTLKKGHRMNYHSHARRDEVWTIIEGEGETIVDGMKQPVHAGDVITIAAGCKHTIIALSDLKVIEVQLGRDIDVNDKVKYDSYDE